jgi:cytochrome bd ubiquinol oxidase subunit II
MDLNVLWFGIIVVLFIGFFFLEGFDYGVGILLPFLGKNDAERRQVVASIGPFWDGNEVWLITAGGAMFAAFPDWYATMFSGFYMALLAMLVALIMRGVAFEFRNRDERAAWRRFWDRSIFGGSLVSAFLWGVAVTNLVLGVPINEKKQFVGGLGDLLNPYALLGGVLLTTLFTLHGAIFLNLKTDGAVMERAHRVATRLWLPVVGIALAYVGLGFVATGIFTRTPYPLIAAGGVAVALLAAGAFVMLKRSGWAFAMTGLAILSATLMIFLGLFPRVMISSLNEQWSLTIYNASSSPYTLGIMSWVALTFVPIMLGYQIWNYWVFRQRVSVHGAGHL